VFGILLPITSVLAQSVDILWQADTHVPPFYRGHNKWSYQSKITFLAIPQGLGNSTNLNYRWTNNGTIIGPNSGVGKNSYSFTDPIISRPKKIKVEIVTPAEEILAESSITVSSSAPEIFVYENNPLYGLMLNREINGTYQLQSGEVTLEAVPSFFSEYDYRDNTISYSWTEAGGEKYTGKSATYRAPENSSGSSLISLDISNSYRMLQTTKRNLLVKFGETND